MMAEKMRNDCMRKAHRKPIQRLHFIVRISSIGSKKDIILKIPIAGQRRCLKKSNHSFFQSQPN